MAEGRIVSKRITRSQKVASLPSWMHKCAYTWLIPYLDVEGRIEADVRLLKSDVFPLEDRVTPNVVEKILLSLQKAGLIILYTINGTRYLQLVKFDENQPNLRKDREAPSKIPPPPSDDGSNSGQAPEEVRTSSGVEPEEVRAKLREVKLREVNTIAWSDEARAFIGIQAEDRKLWSEAYPALNLDQEIAKAAAWVIANPKNKKSNWPRFLNNWLKASQDRAPAKGSEKPFLQAPKPKQPAMKCDKCENYFEETVEYRSQQLCPGCMKKVNPEVDPKIKDMLRVIGKPLNDRREVSMENENEKGKKPVTYEEKTGTTSAGEKFVEVVSKRPKSPEQKEKGEGDA